MRNDAFGMHELFGHGSPCLATAPAQPDQPSSFDPGHTPADRRQQMIAATRLWVATVARKMQEREVSAASQR